MKRGIEIIKKVGSDYGTTIFRASVSAIPYVGGALNEVFSHRANNLKERRLNDFILNTSYTFEKIDKDKINKSFLESEEFTDLVLRCIKLALKTNNNAKAKLFSEILKNSLLVKEFNMDEFEGIEFMFDQISYREFFFLGRLGYWNSITESDYRRILEGNGEIKDTIETNFLEVADFYNVFEKEMTEEYDFTLKELFIIGKTCEQKGLVEQLDINYGKNKKNNILRAYRKTESGYLTTIKPTVLYKHLMKFVKLTKE